MQKGNEEVQAWVKQIEDDVATRERSFSRQGSGLSPSVTSTGSKDRTPRTSGSNTPCASGVGAKEKRGASPLMDPAGGKRASPSLMDPAGGKRVRSDRGTSGEVAQKLSSWSL